MILKLILWLQIYAVLVADADKIFTSNVEMTPDENPIKVGTIVKLKATVNGSDEDTRYRVSLRSESRYLDVMLVKPSELNAGNVTLQIPCYTNVTESHSIDIAEALCDRKDWANGVCGSNGHYVGGSLFEVTGSSGTCKQKLSRGNLFISPDEDPIDVGSALKLKVAVNGSDDSTTFLVGLRAAESDADPELILVKPSELNAGTASFQIPCYTSLTGLYYIDVFKVDCPPEDYLFDECKSTGNEPDVVPVGHSALFTISKSSSICRQKLSKNNLLITPDEDPIDVGSALKLKVAVNGSDDSTTFLVGLRAAESDADPELILVKPSELNAGTASFQIPCYTSLTGPYFIYVVKMDCPPEDYLVDECKSIGNEPDRVPVGYSALFTISKSSSICRQKLSKNNLLITPDEDPIEVGSALKVQVATTAADYSNWYQVALISFDFDFLSGKKGKGPAFWDATLIKPSELNEGSFAVAIPSNANLTQLYAIVIDKIHCDPAEWDKPLNESNCENRRSLVIESNFFKVVDPGDEEGPSVYGAGSSSSLGTSYWLGILLALIAILI